MYTLTPKMLEELPEDYPAQEVDAEFVFNFQQRVRSIMMILGFKTNNLPSPRVILVKDAHPVYYRHIHTIVLPDAGWAFSNQSLAHEMVHSLQTEDDNDYYRLDGKIKPIGHTYNRFEREANIVQDIVAYVDMPYVRKMVDDMMKVDSKLADTYITGICMIMKGAYNPVIGPIRVWKIAKQVGGLRGVIADLKEDFFEWRSKRLP